MHWTQTYNRWEFDVDPLALMMIIKVATQTLEMVLQGTSAEDEAEIADAMVDIARQAMFVYQQETGRPLDPDLIQPIEPLP